ncbi:MAG TPA: PAC2 family protein [Mycobacteriales bacterium]|jgi:proteasome assembly chaperone (PAC2) family protein|nr:PAC2 family protein [Mycobacteriales bacterium]
MTELDGVSDLRSPVMVAAFEGWNDAGDAASGAIEHLEVVWGAEPFAAIDPEDYYDFQVNRPQVTLVDGTYRRIQWPTSRFSLCRLEERDVVLLRGLEPNMRWRTFCEEVIDIARELGIEMSVTLGALLSDSPHTRAVPVSGTASDTATAERLGLERSRYEGPTGIVGVLHDACNQAGMSSVSFWAAVPHYVSQPPSPKATIALLRRVEDVLDIAVPLGELPEQAAEWQEQVDQLTEEDTEVAEYVRQLEERDPEDGLQETSGDAIAQEFERYLRRRGQQSGPGE